MFALAAVLLIAAAALVLWVIFGLTGEHNNDVHFHGFGITANLSPFTVFLLGALTLLLIWAATRLIAAGTKRGWHRRQERKELQKENKDHERQEANLARERDALEKERNAALARENDARTVHTVREGDVVADDVRNVRR